MTPDVTMREYRREDEDVAIRLLVSKLPLEEQEGAYEPRRRRWRWQYYENPNLPEQRPAIFVAEVDGQFGGMVCTVPMRLRTPQGIVSGSWGMDFIVNPEIRGGGIGKRLLHEWIRAYEVSAVLGYTPVSLKVAKSVGFTEQRGATTVRIVLSRSRLATGLMRAGRRRDLQQLVGVALRSNRGPKPAGGFTFDESVAPDPAASDVWAGVAANHRFAVERDLPYLRWRFCAHPHHEYRFINLRHEGVLLAFAVVRLASEPFPLGIVSDLLADPRQPALVNALLARIIDHFRARGAVAIHLDLPPALVPGIAARYPCSLIDPLSMISYSANDALIAAGVQQPDTWFVSRSDADQDY